MSFDVISAHSSTSLGVSAGGGRITNYQREREIRKITKSLNRSTSRENQLEINNVP